MKLPFEIQGGMKLKDTQALFLKVFMTMMKYVIGVCFLFSIANAYLAIITNQGILMASSYFIFPIAFVFIIGVMSIILGYVTHKKKKEQLESMHYTFMENELLIKAIGFESRLAWSNFSKIKESSKFVLLYQGRVPTNLIPKRYFNQESEIKELVTFVKEKISKK